MADGYYIRQRIYDHQRSIDAYEDEISQLYRDISKLEDMSRVILSKRKQLSDTLTQHLQKVAAIAALDINSNITTPYSEGMRKTLTGNEYQDAYDGMTTADRKVNEKIDELQERIRIKKVQISNLHGAISSLRHELYSPSE